MRKMELWVFTLAAKEQWGKKKREKKKTQLSLGAERGGKKLQEQAEKRENSNVFPFHLLLACVTLFFR